MSQVRFPLTLFAIAVALLLVLGWKATAREAYESAEFTVLKSDGPFEIREYPDLMIASTFTAQKSSTNDDRFMRLFAYISGANERKEKVSMTTPVFMDSDPENDATRMSFVIPKDVAKEGAPKPTSDAVQLQRRSAGKFAVIRFPGRMDRKSVTNARKKLDAWIRSEGLTADTHFETAGYDPPWTPGPMRRNEILIRLN